MAKYLNNLQKLKLTKKETTLKKAAMLLLEKRKDRP